MLLPECIHDSWNDFLTAEVLERLNEIESRIGDNFNSDR